MIQLCVLILQTNYLGMRSGAGAREVPQEPFPIPLELSDKRFLRT